MSHEKLVFDPLLNKPKVSSPLNPLMRVVFTISRLRFLYLSSVCVCVSFGFAATVLPGFGKAIYNGLKRNLHRPPV